ncbi:IQ domain-containing protein IQM2-like [Juglans microcarpa x Juglans regia]|uniref:IQ domain-containing protein IQM2-like n=1 Tax=Juglans microcarpa x Juglans regia TaxID=2249226 RepID=UPI001B7EC02B|nr:IQ domain-containing protein IQM2-like [Juglans microcarpa x Juglans regia]XP_040999350.1 IQ domain-containing protein IQM2-like [Juglans microcarpa x Juglans regia]
MGISFSCPFSNDSDVENGLESIIVKSISFGKDEIKTPVRSVSFNSRDSEPMIFKSLCCGKMKLEASSSFKSGELEEMVSVKAPSLEDNMHIESKIQQNKVMDNQSPRSDGHVAMIQSLPILDPPNPKDVAALKLQKVYKSFRTRRKLADCAVLVEQSWWKLLDFAELKRSSISFFDIEKHESAISRWSRARTRAAKVGKGLSKNDRAQKLALQHWLEAIDPRHRYGHNLHYYYDNWLHCQCKEPFFYWLDIGEGKEVNLVERCPRSKLQQQCIKYLGPMERMAYEVVVEDGKFFYKQSEKLLDTTEEDKDAKWIFVLSTSMTLYVGKKKKGTFQHSSFLAGGATSAAGRLVIEDGILKAVWPHSGHYRPTEENFKDFVTFLKGNNVSLTDVKMSPDDEEDELFSKQRSSIHLRSSSEEDLTQKLSGSETEGTNAEDLIQERTYLIEDETTAALELPMSSRLRRLGKKLANLEIPIRNELGSSCNSLPAESPMDGYETAEEAFPSELEQMVPKQNEFNEQHEENEVEIIPEESILKRINSHKGMKSYQLGKQLSFKWTTGAGPRIGCVRDYPSKLQFQALEQVNLSPRSAACSRSYLSPQLVRGLSSKVMTPRSSGGEMAPTTTSPRPKEGNFSQRINHHSRTQSSPLIRGASTSAIGHMF